MWVGDLGGGAAANREGGWQAARVHLAPAHNLTPIELADAGGGVRGKGCNTYAAHRAEGRACCVGVTPGVAAHKQHGRLKGTAHAHAPAAPQGPAPATPFSAGAAHLPPLASASRRLCTAPGMVFRRL